MSLLNKLQFWKHDDEYAAPDNAPSYDLGAPSDPMQQADPLRSPPDFGDPGSNQPFAQQNYPAAAPFPSRQQSPFQQQAFVQPEQHENPPIHPRDVELILAKLDAIKSEMDALHQRIRKIEQATESGKKYW